MTGARSEGQAGRCRVRPRLVCGLPPARVLGPAWFQVCSRPRLAPPGPGSPVPPGYSIALAALHCCRQVDVVMAGWPGAAQDRLPAAMPRARHGRPGVPRRPLAVGGEADGVGSFHTAARVRAAGTSVASRWMQDRVEGGGEVRSAVADHELDPMGLFTEVHEEVAGRLGGPLPGEIRRDAEDADAPGRVCSITARTWAWVPSSRPAVKKSLSRIASAGERRNCDQAGPACRRDRPIPLVLRISHAVDAATLTPSSASSPWILRYPHQGFPGPAGGRGP